MFFVTWEITPLAAVIDSFRLEDVMETIKQPKGKAVVVAEAFEAIFTTAMILLIVVLGMTQIINYFLIAYAIAGFFWTTLSLLFMIGLVISTAYSSQ